VPQGWHHGPVFNAGNMVEAERIPGHDVGVLNGPIGASSALAILPGPYLLDRGKAGWSNFVGDLYLVR
jgi:hypothetical protein